MNNPELKPCPLIKRGHFNIHKTEDFIPKCIVAKSISSLHKIRTAIVAWNRKAGNEYV